MQKPTYADEGFMGCLTGARHAKIDDSIEWKTVFETIDLDGDNKITKEEFTLAFAFCVFAQVLFDAIDKDSDVFITQQEFAKAVKDGTVRNALGWMFSKDFQRNHADLPPHPPGLSTSRSVMVESASSDPDQFVKSFFQSRVFYEIEDEEDKKWFDTLERSVAIAKYNQKYGGRRDKVSRDEFLLALQSCWSEGHEVRRPTLAVHPSEAY